MVIFLHIRYFELPITSSCVGVYNIKYIYETYLR